LHLDRDLARADGCGLQRVGVLERLREAVLRPRGLFGGGDAGGLDAIGERREVLDAPLERRTSERAS
jgi:hypothetical protein